MPTLPTEIEQLILQRLPGDVRQVMLQHGVVLAGGFIRALVAGETPKDTDLFHHDSSRLQLAAETLCQMRGVPLSSSSHPYSILDPLLHPKHTQVDADDVELEGEQAPRRSFVVSGTPFADMICKPFIGGGPDRTAKLISQFDFTLSCAAIELVTTPHGVVTRTACHPQFVEDVRARRVRLNRAAVPLRTSYSLERLVRFAKRGYEIPAGEVAELLAGVAELVGCNQEAIKALVYRFPWPPLLT